MKRHYTLIGLLITVAWCVSALIYASFNWSSFVLLKPNEVGDFFAGVLSPLAFLWLVLGYFQQGQELKLSTDALRLQAEELRNAVKQQRDLVEATREQVAFEKEHNERTQYQQRVAAAPRFQVHGGGSSPSHGPDIGWRRFHIRVANTGAAVTAVKIHAVGWNRTGDQIANFQILERGSSESLDLEMPTGSYSDPVELTVSYVDGLGQDGSIKLRKPADLTGAVEFSPVDV